MAEAMRLQTVVLVRFALARRFLRLCSGQALRLGYYAHASEQGPLAGDPGSPTPTSKDRSPGTPVRDLRTG
jgi:hypothetical protein